MNDFVDKHPLAFIPLFIVFWSAMWCGLIYLTAVFSGWRALAQKFRLTSPFSGPIWRFQSARTYWFSHYNNILTIGADSTGLMLSVFLLMRPGHPSLLIPWTEVTVAKRSMFWFTRRVVLHLGREEQVPFSISGDLADRIQSAAGASWPVEPIETSKSSPSPAPTESKR